MVNANDIKRRSVIMIDGDPYQVLEVVIVSPSARGASTMVKLKVRHLISAAVLDKTFKSQEKFAEADVDVVEAHYLYTDGSGFFFMEEVSFETVEIPGDVVGDASGYLVENLSVKIMKYNGAPVALELPTYVNIEVAETEAPAQKAGSAGAGTKRATLASGMEVRVPQYIAAGEIVRVNTETGEVGGRA